jgi:hypothetical protein
MMELAHDQQEMVGDMEEQQISSFRKIEELENFGINKADITKLKAGGYNTIESVCLLKLFIN